MSDAATMLRERIEARKAAIAVRVERMVTLASDALRRKMVPQEILARPVRGRVFLQDSDRDIISLSLCWNVECLDQYGRSRSGFLRGPLEIVNAIDVAERTFRNWTILSVEPVEEMRPPAWAQPVPPEANEFGVLKNLQSMRRR